MRAKVAVLGLVVSLVVVLTPPAHVAQAQQVTLDAVLKRVGLALAILRGAQEEDSLMMMEYWGSGTMRAMGPNGPGPESKIKYYGSIAYDVPGMRVDFTRTNPDGTTTREIHVVSGTHAWNEEGEIGGGLVPAHGRAIPAMDTVADRLLRLWIMPHGVYKTAVAAGANAKLTVQGNTAIITFPLANGSKRIEAANVVVGPAAGTPVTLTLNPQLRPEKVEVRHGGRMIEMTYTEYGDYNDKDYKSDVQFPRRIVQKVDGQTVLDLTVERTNTYNPYVVMPVPDNVLKASPR